MAVTKRLTQKQNLTYSQNNLSSLTIPHERLFKVIISYQILKDFRHKRIFNNKKQSIQTSSKHRLELYERFGRFLDKTINMSITDVENMYRRKNDNSDATIDAKTRQKVEVLHFCTHQQSDKPMPADSIRIHGYYTIDGYFVIIRLDWHHEVH